MSDVITWRELCRKEVICVCDGARLGYFCDLEAAESSGCIIAFLLPDTKGFSFSKKPKIRVCREWIEKIGDDIVFVRRYERIDGECKK